MNELLQFLEKNQNIDFDKKVQIFNKLTQVLSDFIGLEHPTLNVQLIKNDKIKANDYNPNQVAPPEMKLLKTSIEKDGLTMPVVGYKNSDEFIVVDGFHRTTLSTQDKGISKSLKGYIPISQINKPLEDRMASTIRHNRARGTHDIDLMTNIVKDLVDSGMSDAWIIKNIGMDADELLRLKQVSGLADLFKDKKFTVSND